MQSLIDYAPFWAAYFAFALLGLWCWQKLFFFLPAKSTLKEITLIVGIVLLFTPAPSATESQYLAPAVFVLVFDLLSGVEVAASQAWLWYALSACLVIAIAIFKQLLMGGSDGSKTDPEA